MAKQVTFASNPRQKPSPEDLDAFVHGTPPNPSPLSSTRPGLFLRRKCP